MFLTSDGEFEPVPPLVFDAHGRPSLGGRLIVDLDADQLKRLRAISHDNQGARPSFIVLGRSGHAQVGLELERNFSENVTFTGNAISVPTRIRALGPVREPWLDTILELFARGRRVKVGRILALEQSRPLTKTDVVSLVQENLIAVEGDFGINDDGSVRVYFDPSIFVHDTIEFAESVVREKILVHSRMAIQKYQDHLSVDSFTLQAQSLVVSGIRFSSGPFPALIKSELGGGIRHIRSGVFLDGFRSTRIDRRYGASGVRQIELYNDADVDHVLGPSNFVDIEILPALPDMPQALGVFAALATRKFYHRHGVPLSGVIDLASAKVQDALFDQVAPIPLASTVYARVITPNGLTNIPWAGGSRFQRAKTERGVESMLATRELVAETASISLALRKTVDHGRVFVSHTLPSADELFWLHELGIRAFVFKDVMPRTASELGSYANVFMDGHLHETIHQLSLQGVAFSQVFSNGKKPGAHADVRDFFKGFWCLDHAKIRSESVTTLINMYGWHKSQLLVHSETEVERMLTRLGAAVGPETIGVMHGKGPGFMWLADNLARKLGMLSLGVGIDVEKIGQLPNFLPDFALDFVSYERAYRQKVMDQLGLFKIFNLGGYGTLEEIAITLCSYKLYESVPAPLIFVDDSMAKEITDAAPFSENFWAGLQRQSANISGVAKISYPGDTVDLSSTPFGAPWVANVVHCVPSYDQAAEILTNFIRDPVAYWRRAGVTEFEVSLAMTAYRRRLTRYGFGFPPFLERDVG